MSDGGGYLQFGDGGKLMGLCKIFLLVFFFFFLQILVLFGLGMWLCLCHVFVVVMFYVVGFHEENRE